MNKFPMLLMAFPLSIFVAACSKTPQVSDQTAIHTASSLLSTPAFGTSTQLSFDVQDSKGNTYVGGILYDHPIVSKQSPTGTFLWTKQVGPDDGIVGEIKIGPDDTVYAIAKTSTGSIIIKFDENGNQLWSKWEPMYFLEFEGLAIDNTGNAYVTGLGPLVNKYDGLTGNRIWRSGSLIPGFRGRPRGTAIEIDQTSGKLVVVGVDDCLTYGDLYPAPMGDPSLACYFDRSRASFWATFDSSGTFLKSQREEGHVFAAITSNNAGLFYVADQNNNVFSPPNPASIYEINLRTGTGRVFQDSSNGFSAFTDIRVDSSGHLDTLGFSLF